MKIVSVVSLSDVVIEELAWGVLRLTSVLEGRTPLSKCTPAAIFTARLSSTWNKKNSNAWFKTGRKVIILILLYKN